MSKRFIPLVTLIFLMTAMAPAFADTEDEIVAKYLQKQEKIIVKKIGFVNARFSYGILPQRSGYSTVNFSASNDLASIDGSIIPHEGIYRSNELSLQLGMMLKPRVSLQVGFDYWLTMGSRTTVDYTTTIGVLSTNDAFVRDGEVTVYGFTASSDYYLLGFPTDDGRLTGLALKLGGGFGYYRTSWDYWNEADDAADPLSAGAPAIWLQGGLEYPLPLFDLVIGANASYIYLNFSGFKSYNSEGGDLELISAGDGDSLELNFSGPRAQIELKRYFTW